MLQGTQRVKQLKAALPGIACQPQPAATTSPHLGIPESPQKPTSKSTDTPSLGAGEEGHGGGWHMPTSTRALLGQGMSALPSHAGTLQTSPGKELPLRGHLIPARLCDAQGMVEAKLNSERRTCALDDHTAQGGGRSVDPGPRQPPRVRGVSLGAG